MPVFTQCTDCDGGDGKVADDGIENSADAGKVVRLGTSPPRESRLAVAVRVVVVCAVVALGVVGWTIWRSVHAKQATASIHSIAVLPPANLSGDPSEEFFSEGMTDQLITDLAKVGSLRVISRTSVMQYKGTKKSLPEIARELNVDAIVEGSVIRSGERVRVTAQLLAARQDRSTDRPTVEDFLQVLRSS